jgi:hypothetical protein
MKTDPEEEDYGVANMTADKHVVFQISLSDAKTKATTWSIGDMDCVVN